MVTLDNQRTRLQRLLTSNHLQQKIAKFTVNSTMGSTPINHNKQVIYNIKGNPRQPEDTPTASDTPSDIQSPPSSARNT